QGAVRQRVAAGGHSLSDAAPLGRQPRSEPARLLCLRPDDPPGGHPLELVIAGIFLCPGALERLARLIQSQPTAPAGQTFAPLQAQSRTRIGRSSLAGTAPWQRGDR